MPSPDNMDEGKAADDASKSCKAKQCLCTCQVIIIRHAQKGSIVPKKLNKQTEKNSV